MDDAMLKAIGHVLGLLIAVALAMLTLAGFLFAARTLAVAIKGLL